MSHSDLFFRGKVSAQCNWVIQVGLEKAIIIDRICDLIDLELNKHETDKEMSSHHKREYDAILNEPMFFDAIPLKKEDVIEYLKQLTGLGIIEIEESLINRDTFYVRITKKFILADDYEDYKHIWRAVNE